ncbi:MAG: amidase [Candidatus Rokubacteria bacterium 13_1_20CM_2_68_19]|nr:MAG: amidase [Candidatus Rokubacteria bacterium 13_1_20CM_2_68_19]PYN63232.1 MAG: Asp-tRNA(Asn)/Glu-tRNA(Gln) amidotransferase GatCAB subunit A [Candidatus Rokubacteria bacterium]
MPVTRPTVAQVRALADDLGFTLSDADAQSFLGLMAGSFAAYDAVAAMPDHVPAVRYPRTPGYRPEGAENRYNAWYVKTTVKGTQTGKLAGKTIVLKDNVCLAGVPMMNGASTLEGYVPDVDATIVTRMLDAGGTIVGKAHCEYFCFSGGSHTCAAGPVHNPRKPGYSAGGSSSGSAALVAAGEVDMAIGGDQGGSIRIPASYCGIYGMKPTHGLVPYTGIMPIELTLDHAGPMTATVADNALLLEVLAGADGLDPRQYAPRTAPYTEALGRGVDGLRIGLVKEGFGHHNSEKDVDARVRSAAAVFGKLGAKVGEVSVPMHAMGPAIWSPIALEGATELMMKGNGFGTNWRGLYVTSLIDAHSAWRHRADELSDTLKLSMLLGHYFVKHHRGHFYAKAQNLSRKLRDAYDAALADFDVLVMPTLPLKATPLPPADAPREVSIQRAFEMISNTAPFDATGHPAMSVPCGQSDGLPIGLMLIGKHWEESTIYRAAHAFEQAGDWRHV